MGLVRQNTINRKEQILFLLIVLFVIEKGFWLGDIICDYTRFDHPETQIHRSQTKCPVSVTDWFHEPERFIKMIYDIYISPANSNL